jgi:hypothetical protein
MAENTDADEPEYTSEELHDLVVATVAANEPEAMYLADQLDEAGIPVASMSSKVSHSLVSDTTLRVPRKALAQAKAVIAKARAGANQRGVEQAFDPENVAETIDDHSTDPLLRSMFELRAREMPQRLEQLRPVVSAWLLDSTDPVLMAKYLAAAGLSQDEAADFVDSTAELVQEEWADSRHQRAVQAVFILIGSIVLIVLLAIVRVGTLLVVLPFEFLPLVIGLSMWASSRKRLGRLPRVKKTETTNAENQSRN